MPCVPIASREVSPGWSHSGHLSWHTILAGPLTSFCRTVRIEWDGVTAHVGTRVTACAGAGAGAGERARAGTAARRTGWV